MNRALVACIAVILLLVAGAWDFSIHLRRSNSASIQVAKTKLDAFPDRIGHWEGKTSELDELVIKVANCDAYKNLRFLNNQTGRAVDFTIMVGQPGQMSEHVPEVCYLAGGYTLVTRDPEAKAPDSKTGIRKVSLADITGGKVTGELASIEFVHPRFDQSLRVYHGWFDGKTWSRPDYPRFEFFNRDMLYRVQIAAFLQPDPLAGERNVRIDVGAEFLRDSLPEITKLLSESTTASKWPDELPFGVPFQHVEYTFAICNLSERDRLRRILRRISQHLLKPSYVMPVPQFVAGSDVNTGQFEVGLLVQRNT